MKTISCHRKYPITTNFLDTMLEHSVVIEEGETKLDAYRRGLKELDQIAAELRKEANPGLYQQSTADAPKLQQQVTTAFPGGIPIISKDTERLEIEIDNAETVDRLMQVKKDNPVMPFPVLRHYNKRMDELINREQRNTNP